MTEQSINKTVYDGARKLSAKERKLLQNRSRTNLFLGIVLVCVSGCVFAVLAKNYIRDGVYPVIDNKNYTLFAAILFLAFCIYGLLTVYRALKFVRYMDDINVVRVGVVNISNEGWDHIAYIGKFKCNIDGKNKTLEAPMFWGDIKRIRECNCANLYYVADKILYLGRCVEELTENSEEKQNNTNIIRMDDTQKETVISIIRKNASSVLVKTIVFLSLVWLFVFVLLSLNTIGDNEVFTCLIMATLVTVIISLSVLERFIGNIAILIQAKKLSKDNLYWTVLPVRQCTISANIFERWYRYAHYEYRGKMHRDWMIIGRNQISKVTCLVSESDKSEPYAYLYGWFRGVLY